MHEQFKYLLKILFDQFCVVNSQICYPNWTVVNFQINFAVSNLSSEAFYTLKPDLRAFKFGGLSFN